MGPNNRGQSAVVQQSQQTVAVGNQQPQLAAVPAYQLSPPIVVVSQQQAGIACQQFSPTVNVSQQLQLIAAPACQQSTPAVVVSQQQPQPTTGIATQDVQVINDLDRGSDISPDLSPPKKKSQNYDEECIIMDDKLSDLTINYVQEC